MAKTHYFVKVGSNTVGEELGYLDLADARRRANRTPGAYIEGIENWGYNNERSFIVKEGPATKVAPAPAVLPQLFQGLTARDWSRVREAIKGVEKGDAESVMLSIGYLDVGRTDGGAPYVGAMSFDASGGGGLSYRKVYQMQWPKG